MSWIVNYTYRARQDLHEIYQYIAYQLSAPSTAARQLEQLLQRISSLSSLPLRHRLYPEEPWHSYGLRVFHVNNYLVFYLTDKVKGTVTVLRIMYGGRDIKKQLQITLR